MIFDTPITYGLFKIDTPITYGLFKIASGSTGIFPRVYYRELVTWEYGGILGALFTRL